MNTVAPTFVATPMVLNFFKNKKFKKLALGNIPMGKLATESDIATTVCFLGFFSFFNDYRNINSNRWWMDSKIIYRFFLVLFIFTTSQVNAIEFQGNFTQGHFILGKTRSKSKNLKLIKKM